MKCNQPIRRRDAAATKSAILCAARTLFARDSYENVGIREIASLAGSDAALVSRYFGSKEELFTAVLSSGERGVDVIGTELEGLPERVGELMFDPDDEGKSMEDILIMLHSGNSPIAGPIVRASIDERFHDPFASVIGGESAKERSQLFGSILLGLSISQQISGDITDCPELREKLKRRLADIIRKAIAPL
ncbi:TetR/AcrR family transcriptional regulator [Hyphomonas sp. WL0036]|uniref:TetR/AcrR family transcriptional regulator n=1 Tax=Hyphomonas sediminis TaxID=2866160 RepID=UPI001C81947B|nr:TetR/AcrR family transcriptional regulator [Hyphomonas sediminis]MBY9067189.1 TetR/AcrR family transcriptional regulator [Hyphomonas sediminis]